MLMNRVLILLAFMVATMARGETEIDAYRLGTHAPEPESWLKLDEDLSIRVRILHASNGELAPVVTRPEILRAEISMFGREGAADREVNLTCWVYFKDAEAASSDFVVDGKPCYRGRLSDATGRFVPLDLDLSFRPVASDPAGTSAVVVRVEDSVVDDHIGLFPTYGWEGGRK
jgi:hypothetical protein